MSPRPRKVTDEQVFAAVVRVMERVGPAQLTLAAIAREAGVTAGALVQRFGSKRTLLIRLAAGVADWTGEMFAGLRAAHASPLAVVRAYGDCFAEMAESPGGLAHHLGYLQHDIADPDLRRHLARQSRATREEFRRLLDEAVAAGELGAEVDTGALARAVQTTVTGSLMTWAIYEDGPVARWIREDLDRLLEPYLS